MKIRIKFAKTGVMKFVGHLDVMRYFQKAIRRAELPIAYSEGFSPHMLLSFASPLGVGISSTGEYFDMVLAEDMKTDEIVKRLNATMVEGMEVLSARHVPDGKASKAMSLVAGADYLVQFREGKMPEIDLETKVPEFFALPQIEIMRKTKRSEKLTDIRPWIYDMKVKKSGVWMQLSTGSVSNLKPELVMEAFCKWCGVELPLFVKLAVVGQVGLGHKAQQLPAAQHGGAVVQLAVHQQRQANQHYGVQCAGLRKQPLQRIQCALLQGALQKQVAAGVAGKAKLRENRQLYPLLRGSLQLCQNLLRIIGAVCHPQGGRKSSCL